MTFCEAINTGAAARLAKAPSGLGDGGVSATGLAASRDDDSPQPTSVANTVTTRLQPMGRSNKGACDMALNLNSE
ncbi:hypothetical protein PFUM301598_57680 [Pseudomonas fluorescens]